MEQRNCKRCGGTGKVASLLDKEVQSACRCCDGRGRFDAPDERFIRLCITASQGKNKGKLRSSRPAESGRPYFVWRVARFHGGKDPTMPFNAELEVYGDPFRPELEAMAEKFARENFGTDMAAAARWGRAFGMI